MHGGPWELLPGDQLRFVALAQRAMDTGTRLTNGERRRLVTVWDAVPTTAAPPPAKGRL